LLDPLFIDQSTDAVPGQRPQHRSQQAGDHHGDQLQLALLHIETTQRHDQLRWDRGKEILQKHRREDRGVAQPLIGFHSLSDQLRQAGDDIRKPHGACAGSRKSSMGQRG
tara:strand:+ start:177 stop:506 length:330 start_codon:yes stop_codon:yes gene_type:complete